MKRLVLAALLLAGCTNAQKAADNATLICKDGVEYFVYKKMNTRGDLSISIVPHYKNGQGELFTCTAPQVPS